MVILHPPWMRPRTTTLEREGGAQIPLSKTNERHPSVWWPENCHMLRASVTQKPVLRQSWVANCKRIGVLTTGDWSRVAAFHPNPVAVNQSCTGAADVPLPPTCLSWGLFSWQIFFRCYLVNIVQS
jgi:hypothetical protein